MKLISIYPGLLANKIPVIGLPQPSQNLMRGHFTVSKSQCGARLSSFGIIGNYFFEDERERAVTVTGRRYVHYLENFLGSVLARHPVTEEMFFQQDGATSHTARDTMEAVGNFVP
jgi:hypothetical protein